VHRNLELVWSSLKWTTWALLDRANLYVRIQVKEK
jgi:hypothetical protein